MSYEVHFFFFLLMFSLLLFIFIFILLIILHLFLSLLLIHLLLFLLLILLFNLLLLPFQSFLTFFFTILTLIPTSIPHSSFLQKAVLSLSKTCEILMGKAVCKDEQVSNWEAPELTASQLRYAALDAHCLLGLLDNTIERFRLLHVRGTNSVTEDGSVWPDIGVRGMYTLPTTQPVRTGDGDGARTGDGASTGDGVSTDDDNGDSGGDGIKDETPALSNSDIEVEREEVGEGEEGGDAEAMDIEGSDSVPVSSGSNSPEVKGNANILPFRISLYVKNISN